jgi:L-ascorbate metabolism protein UlaG (beta-lactamase superfamily)
MTASEAKEGPVKIILAAVMSLAVLAAGTASGFESEALDKSPGSPEITFIGHGTLMFRFEGNVIHVDPWTQLADYGKLPKADLVLVTHEHRDHLDLKAIEAIRKEGTVILASGIAAKQIPGAVALKNGDSGTWQGVPVEAVPAYNLVHTRSPGVPYHPKGRGNGYIVTFASKRVYIAGDTENTPEMKALKNIYAAFLPMNLPFTMTPEMVAVAAKALRPKILYPYHYGDTDVRKLVALLKGEKGIDVRIRNMK